MVEESPLKRLPQEGKMKEGNRKAIAEFLGGVSCQCSVTSTVQSLWPDHLPPRRLSPPRALFGQGPYLPLRSPPPSLHYNLRKRQYWKPKSLEQTSIRGPPPNPLWQCRKRTRSLAFAGVDSLGVRGVPSPGAEGRWPFAPGLGMEKAPPGRGASPGPGLPGRCQVRPQSPTLGAPSTTARRPRLRPAPRPTTGDRASGLGPEPQRARPRPTWGGPGGVAKGRSREPHDGAARRRRRLVSPGQSSAAVSRPQTPSGATGTAPLAAAEAATGPPPPPPSASSSSSTSSSPRRRTWREPDFALARKYSRLHARSRKTGSWGGGREA